MPRKPRFVIPGVPMHIVQRGHSREPVFFEDSDYSAYHDCGAHGVCAQGQVFDLFDLCKPAPTVGENSDDPCHFYRYLPCGHHAK